MPREKSSFLPSQPIGFSLTSLAGNGSDNLGFDAQFDARNDIPCTQPVAHNSSETHALSGQGDASAKGPSNNGRIAVIADNSILTHRNGPKGTRIPFIGNGAALPISPPGAPLTGSGPNSTSQASQTVTVSDGVEMKKTIGLIHLIAILVSVSGHASIFVAPSFILDQAGSVGAALVIWLAGGFNHLCQALCFAEMGTMFPRAGGPYGFAMEAFGSLMGFLIMWGLTVLISGPFWAFLARIAAIYILRPVFPDCTSTEIEAATTVLAGWIIVTFAMLNCAYMKYVTKVQTLLTTSKLFALLIIIGAGIYYLVKGETEYFEDPFEGTSDDPSRLALALFYTSFGYGGYQATTTMLAEAKNPSRDPPRATYSCFAIIISMSIMANISYVTLLSPAQVKESTAVASDFIAEISDVLVIVMSVLVAFTSISALNVAIMAHSRLLFAGARNGHMPQILGMVHAKYLTPWPSIFVYTVWALVMLFTGGVEDMMDYISLFSTIMGLVVVGALLYLRYKKPEMERPYKTLLFAPIVVMVTNFAVLVLGIYQKPGKMGSGLVIFFAGIPVYWFGVLWKNKPKEFVEIVDSLTASAQKLFQLSKVKK